MQTDVVLDLDAVTRRFGDVRAVDGVTEQFRRGEYFCILGPSGCGKTTLLRVIAGFERPDTGSIRLHGADITGAPPERRDVNVVFQNYALFPHLNTYDNVAFGLRMKRLPQSKIATRVRDALQLVHLEQEAARLPRQLSGGQQQRVALARALVNRPAVLLLDEPLSALDQSMRARMQGELRRIQRESGVAFLHITHDQAEALTLADRIGVMAAGRFEQVATPHDVYRAPANAFVASFIGPNNLLHARILPGSRAELRNGAVLPVCTELAPGTAALLAVRPHQLRLGRGGPLHGTVTGTAFTGGGVDVSVGLDGGESVTVALDAITDVPFPGTRICVDVDPASILVLPHH